jgi:hypothetical protein
MGKMIASAGSAGMPSPVPGLRFPRGEEVDRLDLVWSEHRRRQHAAMDAGRVDIDPVGPDFGPTETMRSFQKKRSQST